MKIFYEDEQRDDKPRWTDVFINAEKSLITSFLSGFFIMLSGILWNWDNSILNYGSLNEKIFYFFKISLVSFISGLVIMGLFWIFLTPISMLLYKLKWQYKIFIYYLIALILSFIFLRTIFFGN